MKVIVVGGVAGGASAAARIRRLDEHAEIKVFERGENVSYSSCSLPYYVGGVVASEEDLVMMSPEAFHRMHRIDVYTSSEVTAIDRKEKKVTVKNRKTGETYEEKYDKLVLSPGASPVLPKSIKGVDKKHVFTVRDVENIANLKNYVDKAGVRDVVIAGGGFIGIEMAENLKKAGMQVTVIEGQKQILAPMDEDMVQMLHKELDDNGVSLYLDSMITEIEEGSVTAVKQGAPFKVPADMVVMAIGAAPETGLAKEAGLDTGVTGGIKVNAYFQTSDPDIYAVGDAIESFQMQTKMPGRLALAGPAQRQARIAADHMYGLPAADRGFTGASCIKVFGLNAAAVGLNEKAAEDAGLKYESVTVYAPDKVGLMPDCHYLALKLVFEMPSGKILGAQAIGKGEADKRIDAAAAMICMGADIEDLKMYEHCYAPPFSTAKDVLHMAALAGENVLRGRIRQVHARDVRKLAENGAYILDVREADEFAEGHVKGAKNIPLSELRARLAEVPSDVPVYVHCRSSQRSYYACCCLQGNGFKNVVNINGSFLGICLYEYFKDKAENRVPVVTEYNFN